MTLICPSAMLLFFHLWIGNDNATQSRGGCESQANNRCVMLMRTTHQVFLWILIPTVKGLGLSCQPTEAYWISAPWEPLTVVSLWYPPLSPEPSTAFSVATIVLISLSVFIKTMLNVYLTKHLVPKNINKYWIFSCLLNKIWNAKYLVCPVRYSKTDIIIIVIEHMFIHEFYTHKCGGICAYAYADVMSHISTVVW